ncbi:MAG TPA: class I SAM-dependent methyltransferase, partial [Woeseiaceae bacterium]|nr:class I SAM-dependent methyltransferase [Woeseiaceae bacterium]
FALKDERPNLEASCAQLHGTVLDVGCAEGKPKAFLPSGASYIGLDYYSTATDWYKTRPDVFGDAQALPFADNSIDHALLLDVIEHIPEPDRSLAELYRILKPGGSLTLQVPFLYPLHDDPLDFHRWTRHGLRRAAARHGFSVNDEIAIGHPIETAALNGNIALSKTIINWLTGRNPLALSVLVLPFLILTVNCSAWLLARLSRQDDMMPHTYRVIWIKN